MLRDQKKKKTKDDEQARSNACGFPPFANVAHEEYTRIAV